MFLTREQCMNEEYKEPAENVKFNEVIVCNTGEKHDSGFYCMKFILVYGDEIVGCVGGFCDIINLNGIGGYGDYEHYSSARRTGFCPVIDWNIDICDFGVFRIFSQKKYLKLDGIITSQFSIYDSRKEIRTEGGHI